MAISATPTVTPLPQLSPVEARQFSYASTTQAAAATSPAPAKLPTYASPVYRFDSVANIPITIIRDPLTGAVTNQIPPEDIVEKYRRGQLRSSSLGETATAESSSRQTAATTSQASSASKASAIDAVAATSKTTASASSVASASAATSVSIKV